MQTRGTPGAGRQAKREYENMRSENDAAVAKAELWLTFVWGVSSALAVSIMVALVLVFRSISLHVQEKKRHIPFLGNLGKAANSSVISDRGTP
jgi:hypothetical protein